MKKLSIKNTVLALCCMLFCITGIGANKLLPDQQKNDSSNYVEIQIGTGTAANSSSGAPTPYGTYYKSFRQQYLVRASEMMALGAGVGNIESISFFVTNLNNCSAMPNYRIRMKHTTQNVLIATFEAGEYQEVFQEDSFMPTSGWNEHTLSSQFFWDGQSNLLIDIVTDIFDETHTQNASVQFSNAGFNGTLRFHSDDQAGDTATNGTVTAYRSNIKLKLQELNIRDLAAIDITSERIVRAGVSTNVSVLVKNLSNIPESNYQVKLMRDDGEELTSVNGVQIQPMEEHTFNIPWAPVLSGSYQIYGKVVLANDELPGNDETQRFSIIVIENEMSVVQRGYNDTVTDINSGSSPYGNRYASFRQQYLFTAAELASSGAAYGSINYLAFNLYQLGQCGTMYNYRIRLKHSERTDLYERYFEDGDYLQVFQADTFFPHEGWNMHPFDIPFIYNGIDNLIVEVITEFVENNNNADATVFYSATSSTSCLRAGSQIGDAFNLSPAIRSNHRPNIRLYMNVGAMGSVSGTIIEDGFAVSNVVVRLGDTIYHTRSDSNGYYSLNALPIGTHELSFSKYGYESVSHTVTISNGVNTVQNAVMEGVAEFGSNVSSWNFGQVIESGYLLKTVTLGNIGGDELSIDSIEINGSGDFFLQNLPPLPARLRTEEMIEFDVIFAPTSIGAHTATVTIGDDIGGAAANSIVFNGIGVSYATHTVGDGSFLSNAPLDVFYNTSLFETIYTPEELHHFNGMITGLKFYYVFQSSNINQKPVKFWMGTTTQDNLLDGWIRPNELTLVYDGFVDLPVGNQTLEVVFPTPFEYTNGENLVLLVFRAYDPATYTYYDQFFCQNRDASSSILVVSWDEISPPIDPNTVTYAPRHVTGLYPKTTFLLELQENIEYTISGVFNAYSWDLDDVQISATNIPAEKIFYDSQTGAYQITVPRDWEGSVVPSKAGYVIEPSSRDYQAIQADLPNQNYVIKRDVDPASPIINYPADNQVFEFVEPTSITILWGTQGMQPEYYEISFNGGAWENFGQNTQFNTPLLDSGEYVFMVRGVIDSPQAKSSVNIRAKNSLQIKQRGAGEAASVSISVVVNQLSQISGIVYNSQGEALAGVLVSLNDGDTMQTDESGSFMFNELLAGDYILSISKEGYVAKELEISLAEGENSSVDITLFEDVGILAGVIKRNTDSSPIQGVLVFVSEQLQTLSQEDGSYSLILPTGSHSVTFSHDEYNVQTFDGIEIIFDQTTYFNVDFVPISNEDLVQVVKTELKSNYPNPFKNSTVIDLSIKGGEQGKLSIFNVRGQKVFEKEIGEGSHLIEWDGLDMNGKRCSSGIYYYKLKTASTVKNKKLIIIK